MIEIKESDLRSVSQFLIDIKVIFHPHISPNGVPDFTRYNGKKFCLILDRNLLVYILRLVNQGQLKDGFISKLVGSLLFWAEFNNITITSGLAQMEYSYLHKGSSQASIENNIFLEIFKQYNPTHWLDLALERQQEIPSIKINNYVDYSFFSDNDHHFKMHYLEMLKIAQLYFDNSISIENKFVNLHQWIFDNILICKYTTYFAALVFGNKSKIFKNRTRNFDEVDEACTNQAWDLNYLSLWSTQYYYEEEAEQIFLFATHDKEMKELLMHTNEELLKKYSNIFGKELGGRINNAIVKIYKPRERPNVNSFVLDEMIKEEKLILKQILMS